MTDNSQYEARRIQFLIKRDGLEKAIKSTQRILELYRTAVLCNGKHGRPLHYASTPYYRRKFIKSYLSFKQYLSEYYN